MINKDELIKKIAVEVGSTKKMTREFLDAFCNVITDAIIENDSVRIVGFGTFAPRFRSARDCINPSTGEKMHVPEIKYPTFKPGGTFKNLIKNS